MWSLCGVVMSPFFDDDLRFTQVVKDLCLCFSPLKLLFDLLGTVGFQDGIEAVFRRRRAKDFA